MRLGLAPALSSILLLAAAKSALAEPASGPIVLDLRAEGGVLGRAFRYTDPLADHSPALSGQRPADNITPAVPMLRLRVESYPGAALTRAWPASLGLHVDVSGALPTSVRAAPGEAAEGTQSQGQLLLGAQARIRWAAFEIVPRVAWGLHGWYLRPSDGSQGPFPNPTYSFVEVGLGLRGQVEMLTLEGELGLRPGLSAGGLAEPEWFPNTTFLGLVAAGAVGWSLHEAVALRFGVAFVQYGLAFHPAIGRPPERVVGGATDQSVSATLGLEWRLGSPAPARGRR